MYRRLLLTVLLALLLTVAAATVASAATVVVDDDGADCPSAKYIGQTAIQDAIENEPAGTTIIACTGTYTGLTNRIYNSFTGTYEVKPVTIIANGTVTINVNQGVQLYDANITGLTFISNNYGFKFGGTVYLTNITISMTVPSPLFGGVPAGITNEVGANIYITDSTISGGTPESYLISFSSANVVNITNTILDCPSKIGADTVYLANITKTIAGENSIYYSGFTGSGFVFITPHPSLDVRGTSVTLLNSTFYGSVYVDSNNVNISGNIFDGQNQPHFNYYFDNLRYASGAFLYVAGSGLIAHNVFKNAGYLASDYNDPFIYGSMWGALTIDGAYTVWRNSFESNKVGLQALSSSLVYDNIFLSNTIQAVANATGVQFYVDPPINSTNVVGGPYIGGNYWSDYVGYDEDGDGLGDVPYTNGYGVVDGHPLIPPSAATAACPPFAGGVLFARPTGSVVGVALLLPAPLLALVAVKRKGLSSPVSLALAAALAVGLVVLGVFLAYNASTGALEKSGAVLSPAGTPSISGGRLNALVYNPSPYPICVERILVEGKYAPLLFDASRVQYDPGVLEKAVLAGDVKTISEVLRVEPITVAPKDAAELVAVAPPLSGEGPYEVTVITNAGVFGFYAKG